MRALIWNYSLAMAKAQEAAEFAGEGAEAVERLSAAWSVVRVTQQAIACMLERRFDTMEEIQPLASAIQDYALAFARERLAYRLGIGEKALANVARIKAQRELFAKLAK
ncbi:hypothetical protein rolling_24 [Escherichia phage rolling]|uniref:Uncharacterized protein n=1 Tax=Escherichia phage rolling TaxID=2696442 RepID=A0A6B9WKR9_9CAUD|nr:hypothetical protein P9601_gp24 [Escherichia phage rolling]QHR66323.1 hypothetical protein rolling_24 [Escherichia phage rolling]